MAILAVIWAIGYPEALDAKALERLTRDLLQ